MQSVKLSREELLTIVRRLSAAQGSEAEMEQDLDALKHAAPWVAWQNLIFWTSKTPEQIVEEVLTTPPNVIIIPPPSAA